MTSSGRGEGGSGGRGELIPINYSAVHSGSNRGGNSKSFDDDGGYHSFQGRQVKGVLYKLSPMTNRLRERMTKYVHDGHMAKDLRYTNIVYGLMNTSGKKDFDAYWESPWMEEHVHDTSKKRKMDAQKKSLAVRTYIRASAQVFLYNLFIVLSFFIFNFSLNMFQ